MYQVPFQNDQEKWVKMVLSRSDDENFLLKAGLAKDTDLLATISKDASLYVRNGNSTKGLMESLDLLASNPREFFSTLGKRMNICLICGKGLTDAQSLQDGYGPICARLLVTRL